MISRSRAASEGLAGTARAAFRIASALCLVSRRTAPSSNRRRKALITDSPFGRLRTDELRPASEEALALLAPPFHRHQHRSAPLAADADALAQPDRKSVV